MSEGNTMVVVFCIVLMSEIERREYNGYCRLHCPNGPVERKQYNGYSHYADFLNVSI